MSNSYREGQKVSWNWGNGTGHGKVLQKFARKVQRTIKGEKIVRNGTENNPAYLIDSDNGSQVLKRGSELQSA